MWIVGTPSVIGGIAIGLTLLQIHWVLFFVPFLVSDILFQLIYKKAFISAYTKECGPPKKLFYIKAVIIQLLVVGVVLAVYLNLTSA
jgi:hypothetical protein